MNFAKQCMVDGKWVTPTSGPHFCLGDALSKHDWDFIRLAIDNGYTPNATNTGATFIWSDARMENELEALINNGNMHSALWLAALTYKGAMIGGAADISELDNLSGTIVVANPSLMPADFAANVVELYNDPDACREMCMETQKFIRDYFSVDAAWEVIEEDFTRE